MKFTKKDIIIYCFIIYLVIGILLVLIFPDRQALSINELQTVNGLSKSMAVFTVIIRNLVAILLWPAHLFILIFG
jgi:hypothetical protein